MNRSKQVLNKILKSLNPNQLEAVESIEGPTIVIAGPGTGKTQIIASRIANILAKTDTNPDSILCLTFTNAASYNMRDRLAKMIGPAGYKVHFHTFHSFCEEVISSSPQYFIESTNLTHIEELDQINLIKSILNQKKFKSLTSFKSSYYWAKPLVQFIDKIKKENITPKILIEQISLDIDKIKSDPVNFSQKTNQLKSLAQKEIEKLNRTLDSGMVYLEYEKILKKQGWYDYNDQILLVLEKFKKNPDLVSYFREKFLYILVDEYQDTNNSQNEILSLLTEDDDFANLFVVGDDDQSIYRFQGAAIENMLSFRQKFPRCKIIVLNQNYRSTQTIIDASRSLITKNKQQIAPLWQLDKKFKAVKSDQNKKLKIGLFQNGDQENYFVATQIAQKIKSGIKPQKIAVIYRQHNQSESLIECLEKENIDFLIQNGNNILADFEIIRLIKLLEIIAFRKELSISQVSQILFEVLHYPYFKIKYQDIYTLNSQARDFRIDFYSYFFQNNSWHEQNLESIQSILKFKKNIENLWKVQFELTLSTFFQNIIQQTGYYDWIITLPDSPLKLKKLNAFYDKLKSRNRLDKKTVLSDFLNYLDEMNENNISIDQTDNNELIPAVRLMSAHGAKGQEFETVFIIGATNAVWDKDKEKNSFTLAKNLIKITGSQEITEEQRRLFYVALTRAEQELFVTASKQYPESEREHSLTQFIDDINPKYVSKINTDKYKQINSKIIAHKLNLSQSHDKKGRNFDKYIQEIISNFKLSPTSFNNYLKCPKYFLYNNLLKMPGAKNFDMSYGTAVHKALQELFSTYIKNLTLPDEQFFLKKYREAIKEEILTDQELNKALEQGKEKLTKYYRFYQKEWKNQGPPLSLEFDFRSHNVYLNEQVPITGKIDKIELLDKISRYLRVTDYKTSSPKSENEIYGKTAKKDRSLYNQLIFYKILADSDPLFNFGTIKYCSLDFVSDKNDKFTKRDLSFTQEEVHEFKKQILLVWENIQNHNFTHDDPHCQYCASNKLLDRVNFDD